MYQKNEIVKCLVIGYRDYGIFVKVDECLGLIHISEISNKFIKNVCDYAKINETIYAKVLDVDEVNKRYKLSIKDIFYKTNGKDKNAMDTSGFMPLKNNLNIWINEKLKDLNK